MRFDFTLKYTELEMHSSHESEAASPAPIRSSYTAAVAAIVANFKNLAELVALFNLFVALAGLTWGLDQCGGDATIPWVRLVAMCFCLAFSFGLYFSMIYYYISDLSIYWAKNYRLVKLYFVLIGVALLFVLAVAFAFGFGGGVDLAKKYCS